jgi:hypothetical protein
MHGNPGKAPEGSGSKGRFAQMQMMQTASGFTRGSPARQPTAGQFQPLNQVMKSRKMTEKQRRACRVIANSGRILILTA